MPSRKAEEIEAGVVLVDPSGALYEVMHTTHVAQGKVCMWLWRDSDPLPTYFQLFDAEEEIVFIKSAAPEDATDEPDGQ